MRRKLSKKVDTTDAANALGIVTDDNARGCHLSPYQRQELFVAWTHEQRVEYVSRTCNVSLPTVARYRKIDKWDERIDLITAGIAEKIDEMLAASIIVQLHEVMVLRQRAYLEAMKGSFKDARQAFQSYVELCKLEKEIKPTPEDGSGDDVLAVARRIYAMRKSPKDGTKVVREIAADVLEGGKEGANVPTTPLTDALPGEVSPKVPIVPPDDNLGAMSDLGHKTVANKLPEDEIKGTQDT